LRSSLRRKTQRYKYSSISPVFGVNRSESKRRVNLRRIRVICNAKRVPDLRKCDQGLPEPALR